MNKSKCINCGKGFIYSPSQKEGKYCSFKCYCAKRKKKIERKCLNCGKKFLIYPSQINLKTGHNGGKFCSVSCGVSFRNTYLFNPCKTRDVSGKKNPMFGVHRKGKDNPMFGLRGEKSPNWKGGIARRGDGYYRTYKKNGERMLFHRKLAEDVLGRKLAKEEVVHHIDKNSSNNTLNNLIVFPSQAKHANYHKWLELVGLYHLKLSKDYPEFNMEGIIFLKDYASKTNKMATRSRK